MRGLLVILGAVVAVTVAGCYHNTRSFSPSAKAVLQVRNQSFDQMNIYVLTQGGAQTRVGTVMGKQDAYFDIPDWVMQGRVQTLRFVARPIATPRGPVSDEITATPGDTIVLLIPPG